jgi:hypothetical protein
MRIVFGRSGCEKLQIIDDEGRDIAPSLHVTSIEASVPGVDELSRAVVTLEGVEVDVTLDQVNVSYVTRRVTALVSILRDLVARYDDAVDVGRRGAARQGMPQPEFIVPGPSVSEKLEAALAAARAVIAEEIKP